MSSDSHQIVLAAYGGKVATYTFTPPSTLAPTPGVQTQQGAFGQSPSWVAFHPTHPVAYICDEDGHRGVVHAGRLSDLQPIGQASETGGAGPCSAVVVGSLLFVANYLTGSCSIHSLSPNDGSLLSPSPSHVIPFHRDPPTSTGPVSTRQDKSYAHQAIADPSGKWVYIVDLGADCVHQLAVSREAKDVVLVGRTKVAEGAGPRHLAFHRDSSGKTYAYLACELNTTLLSYIVDPSSGSLHPLGADPSPSSLSCLPPGVDAGGTPTTGHARTTSEIAVSPDGRHVYVGTRGDPDEDHIAVFERAASTGEVKWLGWDAIGGRNLRHFSMTGNGRWVVAAGQDSGSVVVLQRDEETGRLSKVEGAEQVRFEKVAFAGVVVVAAAAS